MRALTFIFILILSLSVYAKTEAGLNIEGLKKVPKPTRGLATAAVNDMSLVMAQLNNMNKAPRATTYRSNQLGFGGNQGALTKPQKKSAIPTKATADSGLQK